MECVFRLATAGLAIVGLLSGLFLLAGPAWAAEPSSQESRPVRGAPPSASAPSGAGIGVAPSVPGKPAANAAASPGKAELAGEVMPKLFYLKDKDGNLQAVPGFSFEDFIDLYKLKNRLDQQEQKPRFNIDRMLITGEAKGDRAELTIDLRITLGDSQWVRIPLRFGSAVLREPAHYEGGGESVVHFDGEREGYTCWLRADPAQPQSLSLRVLAPLSTAGGESRLKLSARAGQCRSSSLPCRSRAPRRA